MNIRQPIPLEKSYLLLNHGPVTLISSAHGDKQNVMSVSWAMPVDFSPAKVAVVIDSRTFTRELIEASGEFVINIPSKAIASKVLAVGSQSGRNTDKFSELEIGAMDAQEVAAPLIEGCVGWLECKIIPETHIQNEYDLFIAEVVAAWADPEVFRNGRWEFSEEGKRTIHYLAGSGFLATGDMFEI